MRQEKTRRDWWQHVCQRKADRGGFTSCQRKIPAHGKGNVIFQTDRYAIRIVEGTELKVIKNISKKKTRLIDLPALPRGRSTGCRTRLVKKGINSLIDFMVEKGVDVMRTRTGYGDIDVAQTCNCTEATGINLRRNRVA